MTRNIGLAALAVLSLLSATLACDDGPPSPAGGTSAKSVAQQRQGCLAWCTQEAELGCTALYGPQVSCTARCTEGGPGTCGDPSAVTACFQAHPEVFGCSSTRQLDALAPCQAVVAAYRKANDLCFPATDYPGPTHGPGGQGAAAGTSGAAGSGN